MRGAGGGAGGRGRPGRGGRRARAPTRARHGSGGGERL
uniref:Uncharacterized protein n=1 Tax=Arundo donax TaxID=35708 RepID=A0A0A8Y5M4_ARUDO